MAIRLEANIKYSGTVGNYGGGLIVSKFQIHRRTGTEQVTIDIELMGTGYLDAVRIQMSPELAIPLARNILNAAEGYVAEQESVVP